MPTAVHPPVVIDRTTPTDLMQLASEVPGSPMQVAAVLVLSDATALDLTAVRDAIDQRIRAVPRLRQRLVRTRLGGGRPIWVDDPAFDIRRHVGSVDCPTPGDEAALLAVVADIAGRKLPADRPLWSAMLVTALAGGGAALIVTLHHVVADGIGGLAVLARLVDGAPSALVDGAPTAPDADFPRPAPDSRAVFRDAFGARLRTLTHPAAGFRHLRSAVAGLAGATSGPPRSSLNHPIGARRGLAVARADLADVRRVAHAHGATVNDIVLTAVTGALHAVLWHRGEGVNRFVVSVPISARRGATDGRLGNQVGVMPVPVTAVGDPYQRLAAIAHTTRSRRPAAPGATTALLGPAFRILARLNAFRWFADRQRLVTTMVTNLRGPGVRLSFLTAPITEVIPVSPITGNVTVAFAVLSYAGTLVVTVIADPQHCPDLPILGAHLQSELDLLTADQSAASIVLQDERHAPMRRGPTQGVGERP